MLTSQHKEILKYTAYFMSPLVFLAMLVAALYLAPFGETGNKVVDRSTITSEQVQLERVKLSDNNPNQIISQNTFQEPTPYDSYIPNFSDKKTDLINKKPVFDDTMNLYTEESSDGNTNLQLAGISGVKVYNQPKSGATMEVRRLPDEKINKTVEGTVFEIKNEIGRITLVQKNDKGLASIILRPDTQFLVNDKNVTINDLKVADRLIVKGVGLKGNSAIEADSIELIGFVEMSP